MTTLETLRREWRRGDPMACLELASRLSPPTCAFFSADALNTCLALFGGPTELFDVVRTGEDAARWSKGHVAFDAVRDLVLRAPARAMQHDGLLSVGESAARVIYNATCPRDPFDDYPGELLFATLAAVILRTDSEKLEASLWGQFVTRQAGPGEELLARLRTGWLEKDGATCKQLAARLSPTNLARFATEALGLCVVTFGGHPALSHVVHIGRYQPAWGQAEAAREAVSALLWKGPPGPDAQPDVHPVLLSVGERAARAISQARSPRVANQDEEASELFLSLVDGIRCAKTPELEARVWTQFLSYSHRECLGRT